MKKKVGLLIATTILFIVVAFFGIEYETNSILGIYVVDQQEWETLIRQREPEQLDVDMVFQNVSLPYLQEEEVYLLSQSVDGGWQGVLGTDGDYNIRILQPECSKQELMASGETIRVILYDEDLYDIKTILVSGLPVVSLSTESDGETAWYGSITLVGANMLSQGDWSRGSPCRAALSGGACPPCMWRRNPTR